jgi:hypothetical protein
VIGRSARKTSVPIFLKPDALTGPTAFSPSTLATDYLHATVFGLSASHFPEHHPAFHGHTRIAAAFAREYLKEVGFPDAGLAMVRDLYGCQERLLHCARRYSGNPGPVAVQELVERSVAALGFEVSAQRLHRFGEQEFDTVYRSFARPDMRDPTKEYLVGNQVLLMLLEGEQYNSVLQVMKVYLRYILKYPYDPWTTIQNYLHVCDQGAAEMEQLRGLLTPSSRHLRKLGGRP